MLHLDLFSGIGGFAYAADQVWDNVEHIFCDNDKFCQQVIKKHWPESEIYGDIRQITADPYGTGLQRQDTGRAAGQSRASERINLLTGGFPCQPFSAAGLRKGTSDERHLWPEMLRVIRLTQPQWVIAENVYGLVTWDNGLQFEQVCADLEASGYEVQAFVIPAAGVGAPHKRDRVWICAHADRNQHRSHRHGGSNNQTDGLQSKDQSPLRAGKLSRADEDVANSSDGRCQQRIPQRKTPSDLSKQSERYGWEQDWHEVATRLCGMDDGVPRRVDRLKSLGNAIVPQIAIEIMLAIRQSIIKKEKA